MATLDADQLKDIRTDVGDDGTVFTDAELHRFYTRADSDYNKAVVLAFRALKANAAKLNDYRLAQSMESKSQVYDHIDGLLKDWVALAENKTQISIVGLRNVPTRDKDTPDGDADA